MVATVNFFCIFVVFPTLFKAVGAPTAYSPPEIPAHPPIISNPTVEPVVASHTDPAAFYAWFTSNPVRAEDWLKGKAVAITGTVETITKLENDDESQVEFQFSEGSRQPNHWFRFRFAGQDRSSVAKLSIGQTVEIDAMFVRTKSDNFDFVAVGMK